MATILHHHVNNYFCKFSSINGNFNQLVIYYFGQAIDNDKNQVIIVTLLDDKH